MGSRRVLTWSMDVAYSRKEINSPLPSDICGGGGGFIKPAPRLGFTETLKGVLDAEVSEDNIEFQDELFFTRTLANAPSKYVVDSRRHSLREVLLRARSNKLQTETQGSFFDSHTLEEEQQ